MEKQFKISPLLNLLRHPPMVMPTGQMVGGNLQPFVIKSSLSFYLIFFPSPLDIKLHCIIQID